MTVGVLDAKDRLRIPREIRDALGLKAGNAVFYALVDGELRIRRADDPYAHYGPVARQVRAAYQRQAERFLTLEQAMEGLGITDADLDAVEDESADEIAGADI